MVLIRHGESEWNAVGRWQGHSDIGLSPLGRRQADVTAEFLARHESDVRLIVASDLVRVTQTAAPAARAFGLDVHLDRRLREIDVGWWRGLTSAEIADREPAMFAEFRAGRDVPRGGAETEAQLRSRVTAAVEELRHRCADGTLLAGPRQAVDLRYVLTFSGDESTLEPQRMLEALFSDVREFSRGAPQSDDITAMVVRYQQ